MNTVDKDTGFGFISSLNHTTIDGESKRYIVVIQDKRGDNKILFEPHEVKLLYSRLRKYLQIIDGDISKDVLSKSSHKPYSCKYLMEERARLLKYEQYEYINDIDFIINLLEERERSKLPVYKDEKKIYTLA